MTLHVESDEKGGVESHDVSAVPAVVPPPEHRELTYDKMYQNNFVNKQILLFSLFMRSVFYTTQNYNKTLFSCEVGLECTPEATAGTHSRIGCTRLRPHPPASPRPARAPPRRGAPGEGPPRGAGERKQ